MSEKILGLIGIGICAILLFGVFMAVNKEPAVVGNTQAGEEQRLNTVSVTGVAEEKVMPDQAILRLAVMTESLTAANAEEENSLKMNRVMKALRDKGIAEKDIVTEYYNLYPYQNYNYQTGRSEEKGFRAQHTLRVTVRDIAKAGEIMDVAVSAGVTNVDSVSFSLTDDKEKQLREELIGQAASKARERANLLVDALGAKVGKVVAVSETGYQPPIYYARDMVAMKAEAGSAPNAVPTITPEEITVSVQINVEFAIE
ncbi:SIMPL domain-containing protein [Candidatus Woesearchaeota archaeon]|nr:SIMPL domain-containing protein [Candidatus Woesearchaeota archaeon]